MLLAFFISIIELISCHPLRLPRFVNFPLNPIGRMVKNYPSTQPARLQFEEHSKRHLQMLRISRLLIPEELPFLHLSQL